MEYCGGIIDEISMIDSGYISKLDALARALRTRGKPMGGLRVIMCGDFLHLPPVTKDYDKLFLSEWWKTAKVQTILFRNPMRQKEPWFVADLNSMRMGLMPQEDSVRRTC